MAEGTIMLGQILFIIAFAILYTGVFYGIPALRNKVVLFFWRKKLKNGSEVQYINPNLDKPISGIIYEIDKENGTAIVFSPVELYICKVDIQKLYPWHP
jgi:hypothetical protein